MLQVFVLTVAQAERTRLHLGPTTLLAFHFFLQTSAGQETILCKQFVYSFLGGGVFVNWRGRRLICALFELFHLDINEHLYMEIDVEPT